MFHTVHLPGRKATMEAYVADSHMQRMLTMVAEGWTADSADAHLSGVCDHMVCTGDH